MRATASEITEPSGKEGKRDPSLVPHVHGIIIVEFYESHIWIFGGLKLIYFLWVLLFGVRG